MSNQVYSNEVDKYSSPKQLTVILQAPVPIIPSVDTIIPFDLVLVDNLPYDAITGTRSISYDPIGIVFTVNKTAMYNITYVLGWEGDAIGIRAGYIIINSDPTNRRIPIYNMPIATGTGYSGAGFVQLTAGDTFEFFCYQTAGRNLNLNGVNTVGIPFQTHCVIREF